jgi:hypothetical protein
MRSSCFHNEIVLDIEDNGAVTLLFSDKSEQDALIIQKHIAKFRLRRNYTPENKFNNRKKLWLGLAAYQQ